MWLSNGLSSHFVEPTWLDKITILGVVKEKCLGWQQQQQLRRVCMLLAKSRVAFFN